MNWNRGLVWLLAAAIVVAGSGALRADELDALYARILREPTNSELNLRFARLAEERGNPRWALAAYERVVLNDPNNFEAKVGLMRVRRAMQPNITVATLELGTAYESNPLYYMPDGKGEWLGHGLLALRDERHLNGQRWRTNAAVGGQVHGRYGDLNYAHAGGETGPVIDLLPGLSMAPAIGGAVSYFNDRFYYGEVAGSATFEGSDEGWYRALRLRATYRDYDDFFPSQHGWYYEIRGRLAKANLFGEGTTFILSPWVLWSDISGAVTNALVNEVQPGAYVEWGGRVEIYKIATDWLTLGANLTVSRRDYRRDIVVTTNDKREDTLIAPGVTALFPGFFWNQADLRLDYRYLRNNSNDATKEFEDHLVSATMVKRFDPTAPNWGWSPR